MGKFVVPNRNIGRPNFGLASLELQNPTLERNTTRAIFCKKSMQVLTDDSTCWQAQIACISCSAPDGFRPRKTARIRPAIANIA